MKESKPRSDNRKDLKTRSILASLNEGILVVNKDYLVVLMNETAERILCKRRESVIGKDIVSIFNSSLKGVISSAITTAISEKASLSMVESVPDLKKVLKLSFSPFSDADKNLEGTIIVISDVTQIDREREEKEAILSGTSDGLIFFDKNDSITYLNPAALEMLNVQKEEVAGEKLSLFELLGKKKLSRMEPVKCKEMLDCKLKECLAYNSDEVRCWLISDAFCQDESWTNFETKIQKCRDCVVYKINSEAVEETGLASIEEITIVEPAYKVIKVKTNPVVDRAGNYLGYVKTLHDITAEKKVDQMKNEFVSTVSHELRTPLTSIKGYIDLILEGEAGEINEIQREFLNTVKQNNNRLVALINDLLDISRIESGRVHLRIKPVNFYEIVDETVNTFKTLIDKKSLNLSVSFHDEPPIINVDRDRICQVMANLLSNAIKYTPANGKIGIDVVNVDGEVFISIKDTGIGISLDDQQYLFTKFYRVDSSLTREIGGSGLGLSICKTIIELHGGRIWVDSEAGKGSVFTVALPVAAQKEEVIPEVSLIEVSSVIKSHKGKRILVVDDEPDIAKLIQIYLEKEGYFVIKAFNGEEAIALARKEKPDLVTLDIMMEKMDGFEVLRQLKNDPSTLNIPVVILSIVSDERKGFRIGATDYLSKPINPRRLVKVINDILGKKLYEKDKKRKILIADDDANIIKLLSRVLKGKGFEIFEANNGLEAIKLAEEKRPHLVLLDLRMPEMDGYQVIEKLKKSNTTSHIPIVVMTAYEFDRGKTRILNMATEHLSKSFSVETLTTKLEEILREGF